MRISFKKKIYAKSKLIDEKPDLKLVKKILSLSEAKFQVLIKYKEF